MPSYTPHGRYTRIETERAGEDAKVEYGTAEENGKGVPATR
jgi:hypothetical protein